MVAITMSIIYITIYNLAPLPVLFLNSAELLYLYLYIPQLYPWSIQNSAFVMQKLFQPKLDSTSCLEHANLSIICEFHPYFAFANHSSYSRHWNVSFCSLENAATPLRFYEFFLWSVSWMGKGWICMRFWVQIQPHKVFQCKALASTLVCNSLLVLPISEDNTNRD